MVVQHNVTAMNSNRMLGITTNLQATSAEKLASGYKINRAADDAAGLSISEKMRKQMRGLDQASTNADDGISTVQTAEGALAEVHDMLQRMNELAVQAANGTNSESDRSSIQDEIDQLTTEIDRVAETTKFNETYLLKGNGTATTQTVKAHDAGLDGVLTQSLSTARFTMDVLKGGDTYTIAGKEYDIGITATSAQNKASSLAVGKTITIDNKTYTIASSTVYSKDQVTQSAAVALIASGSVIKIDAIEYHTYGSTNSETVISANTAYAKVVAEIKKASNIGATKTSATLSTSASITMSGVSSKVFTFTKGKANVTEDLTLNLHVGADADMTNKIGVDIQSMSTANLGLNGLTVSDGTGVNATYAIDAIEDAIKSVSAQRSALGAVQNRLEHTIKNLDNVVENTTAAESRIRDTDMATEMVEYSKNNILAQAGQSMLAQANQSNQGVLSLLG